jgi:adenylate kinase family enzyme
MKRIVIIGSGGAGKTSLALDLGKKFGIPVHHLDAIFWRPGWKPMERREFEAAQRDLMGAPAWVIDGNYGGTMELRLAAADTIIFMDLPRATCLFGALKRRIQQRTRPDKVAGNRERLTLEYLLWIWNYRSTRRLGILKRLETLRDEKTIIILGSRAQTTAFLAAA